MYKIRKARNGQFYFVLTAKNGEVILTSEQYTQKHNCLSGIESVKSNSRYDSRYRRKVASNGQFYFNLVATNGEVIGTSETYVSKQGMESGISSVKVNGPNSRVIDLTNQAA